MPPEDEPRPEASAKTEFLDDLSHQLVTSRKILSDTGGEITMRRLNRREYENTLEDLLGVEVDASELPKDARPGEFDTVGSSLFFSSDQFEQYLKIARRVLDETMVSASKPKTFRGKREAEETASLGNSEQGKAKESTIRRPVRKGSAAAAIIERQVRCGGTVGRVEERRAHR